MRSVEVAHVRLRGSRYCQPYAVEFLPVADQVPLTPKEEQWLQREEVLREWKVLCEKRRVVWDMLELTCRDSVCLVGSVPPCASRVSSSASF